MSKAEQVPLLVRGTDLAQTSLNMINCFVGAGILTVPFAFRLAGHGALIGLALVAALNWCTSLLLGRALDRAAMLRPDVPIAQWDFGQLGLVAFGPTVQWIISALFALELWFAMETFLVLTGINVSIVTGASRTYVIMGAGLAGMLSLSLPMRLVAGFSCLSICCMVGGLVALTVCGIHNTAHVEHKVIDPGNMVSSAGIFLYCFSGLPCLPNIRSGMQKPKEEYRGAVHLAFVFTSVYYATVGFLGYHYYGSATRESFTENLMPDTGLGIRGAATTLHGSFALLSAGLFAVKLQAGFPLYAAPVLNALGVGGSDDWECFAGLWLARLAFIGVSVAFAVLAQGALDAIAELMGAFLTNFTSIIFPCAAYIAVSRASGDTLGFARTASLLLIISLGLVFAAVGSYSAWTRFWQEEKSTRFF
jgi:amino acid permease